jgi:hypothetical protein
MMMTLAEAVNEMQHLSLFKPLAKGRRPGGIILESCPANLSAALDSSAALVNLGCI